jgi:glutamyl/glutaminyl-tRNA synthetase
VAGARLGTKARISAVSCGPYRQSERLHLYESYANELVADGHAVRLLLHARAARRRAARGRRGRQPARYSGRCRAIDSRGAGAHRGGERPALRFRVPADRESLFTDAVRGRSGSTPRSSAIRIIVRADGMPAYNFAVVVDDALMEITHVIRGEDHISNTPRQLLLYEALGFSPPLFAHLALVLGPDHSPLSKRHGATSVAEFRARATCRRRWSTTWR